MKEWLLKTEDGKYHYYRDDMSVCPKYIEKIEIPEDCNFVTIIDKKMLFWLYSGLICCFENGGISAKYKPIYNSVMEYLNEFCGEAYIIWERKVYQTGDDSVVDAECFPEDKVNQPNHYANFSIECIDAMQAMLSREEFIGYLRGNIFKYLWRYKLKNGVEDLKKAQWYQNKLIEVEENE